MMNMTKSDYEYRKARAVRNVGSLRLIDDLLDIEIRNRGNYDFLVAEVERLERKYSVGQVKFIR